MHLELGVERKATSNRPAEVTANFLVESTVKRPLEPSTIRTAAIAAMSDQMTDAVTAAETDAVDERHRRGAFADRAANALYRSRPHVADCIDARHASFEGGGRASFGSLPLIVRPRPPIDVHLRTGGNLAARSGFH
jgi:hypothetical protein